MSESKSSCPCTHGTPCDERCTCVTPTSSVGCAMCCSYGSLEQREAHADYLRRMMANDSRIQKANDLLRSLYSVVERKGLNTNWSALRERIEDTLIEQSKYLNDTEYLPAATATAKTFKIYPDPVGMDTWTQGDLVYRIELLYSKAPDSVYNRQELTDILLQQALTALKEKVAISPSESPT